MFVVCLPERLRKLRIENGYTQDFVAARIGITRSTLSSYENEMRQPSLDILVKIAIFYKTSTDYLLGIQNSAHYSNPAMNKRQTAVINELVEIFTTYTHEIPMPVALKEVIAL